MRASQCSLYELLIYRRILQKKRERLAPIVPFMKGQSYMHTYIIYIYMYIHTYTHTYIYIPFMKGSKCTIDFLAPWHSINPVIHFYIYTYIHTYIHTNIYIYTCYCCHIFIHIYIHTYIHIYMYIPVIVVNIITTYYEHK